MNVLEKAWEEISKQLGYPNIPHPEFSLKAPTAFINMETKQIEINPEFINSFNQKYSALKGVLAHEINHHVTFPYDLPTNMALSYKVKQITQNNAETIANYYSDVVINLDLMKRGNEDIINVYKELHTNSKVDGTIKALYQTKTGEDFLLNKKFVNKSVLNKIEGINYYDLEIKKLLDNSQEFTKAIMELFEYEDEEKLKEGLLDRISKEDYTFEEITRAANQASHNLGPSEYLDATNNNFNAIKDYYESLAKKYKIKVNKEKIKTKNPYTSYKEWEPGMDTNNIDLIKSYGKIFPTRTITKSNKFKTKTKIKQLTDAIILIDSSGSMISPEAQKSPAIIGAYAITNYYLDRKKKVGVVNFSNKTLIHDLSDNNEEIKNNLLYSQQGFTELNMGKVCKSFKDKKLDYYMITDMGIQNFKDVYNTFNSNLKDNRVSIINISSNKGFLEKDNVRIYNVSKEEDIPKLIIKELGERNGL